MVIATSASISWHNWCFLEGLKVALVNSADWHGGYHTTPAVKGTRALLRVHSTRALSQAWFREGAWEHEGFRTLEDYLDACWSGKGQDANELLCMPHTWRWRYSQDGLLEDEFHGALRGVKAKTFVI